MADTFHLHVVTPSGAALKAEVSSLTITSKQGEITVLPGHCLLLSALRPGRMVTAAPNDAPKTYAVAGGYLEAGADHVNVICDRCKAADAVDADALPIQIADLEKKLAELDPESPELSVTDQELKWLYACKEVALK